MQIDELAALLKRYHEDRCTPEERKIVEEWYESLSGSEPAPEEKEVESSLEKVWARLRETTAGGAPGGEMEAGSEAAPVRRLVPFNRRTTRRVMEIAAAVLLLAGVYTLAKRTGTTKEAPEDTVLIATVPGEVKQLTLPDGSRVTVNASSRLAYAKSFKTRQVRLMTGEAFFEVTKDQNRPFTVETKGINTRVLGTSFNIRSYDRDTATVIALVTGKVSVDETTTLDPGDELTVNKSGNKLKTRFDDEKNITAWEQKAMYFRDASFEDIAFDIANTYNVTLVNASSKKHWSYTGFFEHESIWEIVRTICITEHLDFRSDQGRIILINKN
ncbi:FecR family protein [Dinghuibacter silviterrae]|uniref:FecR family protein n=1 Tax=Dinghuibacter silviterrae TaxID=1539049 RepID=A0A4R8DMI3_9BACT|nr:FecR family protein [Dinghuibacter silviterrae]TDW99201.1 FecR family protein [Dinghuibacter silviterrae]